MRTEVAPNEDVRRLARRCEQHEHVIERLSDALRILRTGNDALRAENRELRIALEQSRRSARAA